MTVHVGDLAPDFELPSNDGESGRPGKKYKLSDLRGQVVVLAFYPEDFSPVCTKEHSCFVSDLRAFESAGALLFGVSVDSAWTHDAFARQLGVRYPLLSDFHPKGATAKAYGLYDETYGVAKRATVIVDREGRVAQLLEHEPLEQRDDKVLLEAVAAIP